MSIFCENKSKKLSKKIFYSLIKFILVIFLLMFIFVKINLNGYGNFPKLKSSKLKVTYYNL